ncbi:Uncharacterized mitochondrial protein AtMg00300, partial [Striga hermonthica]
FVSEDSVLNLWHSRLGHAASDVIKRVLVNFEPLLAFNKELEPCAACLQSKSHRLPFNEFVTSYSAPFQLVCTDLWGPSPIKSQGGYSYYMSL